MPDHLHRLNTLFKLYLDNSILPQEYQELLTLIDREDLHSALSEELKELWVQSARAHSGLPDRTWNERMQFLMRQLEEETGVEATPPKTHWQRYGFHWAAAVLIIAFSSTAYFLVKNGTFYPKEAAGTQTASVPVVPGSNRAVLTLADGTSVLLDSSANGAIASQGNTKVIKLNTGVLAYQTSRQPNHTVLYNTLSTPRGGQYQVTLCDGTVVWLNSASSLRYPTVFQGAERRVEVTGEVYFEVAPAKNHPFKVDIRLPSGEAGEVDVLGTHFNINAFDDESAVRTTLFEGSVKVRNGANSTLLKPGQQLQAGRQGEVTVTEPVYPEEVIAWKEGRFQFEDADIRHVMRQIARWYDIDVEYKGMIARHFDGAISKNVDVTKVLNMLELTGEVRFRLEGRKVTVLP